MVVDIGEVKRYIKPKADSTLNNMRKSDLIEYIRCLENNYNVAVPFNENQAKYIESLGVLPMWVSVAERLPEVTKEQKERIELDYLLAPEFNVIIKGAKKATTLYYDGDGSWFDMGGTCYTVAYWMPMPEPPKGE